MAKNFESISRNRAPKRCDLKNMRGFSVIELLVVLAIIGTLSGVSLFYLTSHRRLLKPGEISLQVADVLQEARQRALTQRETIRVEIDVEDNVVRLVDENTTSIKTDTKIRQLSLLSPNQVKVDQPPADISAKPNPAMNLPNATFKQITTSTNANHRATMLRFKSDGTVIDINGKPNGAIMYFWSLKNNQPNVSEIAIAITVEPSGLIRYWQYDKNSADSDKWKKY